MKIDPEFQKLIPPLSPEELAQLEANILSDGCRDPLVVWTQPPDLDERDGCDCKQPKWSRATFDQSDLPPEELWRCRECGEWQFDKQGTLLDGHNRLAICQRHKIEFQTVEIELKDRDAALDWIDTNQLGRRNLTKDQTSAIRGRLYNRTKGKQGGSGSNQHKQKSQSGTSADVADAIAEKHGVSRATVIRDGKRAEALDLLAKTHPEDAQKVWDGKLRFNEVRRAMKLERVKKVAKLPDAKFRVIYADPPWKYGDQLTEDYGSVKFHYPAMSIAELCAMPIRSICEIDAVLFLWVTSPLLYEAAAIIDAWGFAYKASFVWDKIQHNMGHYNSVRHELLLICTKGSCIPDVKKLFDSVISIKRAKHSEKPEFFREIIDTLYPHGKRIELFARKKTKNWNAFGNQA